MVTKQAIKVGKQLMQLLIVIMLIDIVSPEAGVFFHITAIVAYALSILPERK